jgi:hypothetical protein
MGIGVSMDVRDYVATAASPPCLSSIRSYTLKLSLELDTNKDNLDDVMRTVGAMYGVQLALAPTDAPVEPTVLLPVETETLDVHPEPQGAAAQAEPVRQRRVNDLTGDADSAKGRGGSPKAAVVKKSADHGTISAGKATARDKSALSKAAPSSRKRNGAVSATAPRTNSGGRRKTRDGGAVRPEAATVRAWARQNNVPVSVRGTIGRDVYEQYAAAHA